MLVNTADSEHALGEEVDMVGHASSFPSSVTRKYLRDCIANSLTHSNEQCLQRILKRFFYQNSPDKSRTLHAIDGLEEFYHINKECVVSEWQMQDFGKNPYRGFAKLPVHANTRIHGNCIKQVLSEVFMIDDAHPNSIHTWKHFQIAAGSLWTWFSTPPQRFDRIAITYEYLGKLDSNEREAYRRCGHRTESLGWIVTGPPAQDPPESALSANIRILTFVFSYTAKAWLSCSITDYDLISR